MKTNIPDYLQKELGREEQPPSETENVSIAFLRKSERASMLSCVMKSGESTAFPYAHLGRLCLTPDGDIVLEFTNHRMCLTGQRLKRLYDLLLEYRIISVREVSGLLEDVPADAPLVEKITITRSV